MLSGSKRITLALVFLVIVAVPIVFAARIVLFSFSAFVPGSNDKVIVLIRKAEPPSEIAKLLSEKGVISDPRLFMWVGRLSREWKKIKAGEYEVSSAMTPIEVFSTLSSGISVNHPVTVREGENMYEIAADMESKGLGTRAVILSLCKSKDFIQAQGLDSQDVPVLEGYLFPDTYFFNRTMTPDEMLKQMVHHFKTVWTPEFDKRLLALSQGLTSINPGLKMNRHQLITLASIIEKETGAPRERPMIASVFYNRLRKKMRLQSDATTIYGMWSRYTGKIHSEDHFEVNPYNTYAIPALPVGPIANPGREAIEAALFPATTDYLFFVSHNDGTHEFTRTFEDHSRAVTKFQLDPKMREGKSWRDLRKKKPLSNP